MNDLYHTLSNQPESFLKEKGSKFFGYAFPAASVHQAEQWLDFVREKHQDCKHICYAYRLGTGQKERIRTNDAGEPSGTAGKPIHGQILSFNLTDILVVVTRYFGGTKLGTGGLIQAYKTCAKLCLEKAVVAERYPEVLITGNYDYPQQNSFQRIVNTQGVRIIEQMHGSNCRFLLAVRTACTNEIIETFKQLGIDVHVGE